MKILKRDGRKQDFNKEKIVNAVNSAFKDVDGELTPSAVTKSNEIARYIESLDKDMSVEEIQDIIENRLMNSSRKDVAKAFIIYRDHRTMARENTIDSAIGTLIDDNNTYWKSENANKNPVLNTTKRDYIAGIVSSDATNRYLLPPDIVRAHKEGIIHFHDADYFIQHETNCCLINLDDMLQNGTMISETLIEKPHSFSTACTVTTQIIAQVASSQYGGQSINLRDLAPFVDVSRKKIDKDVREEISSLNISAGDGEIQKIVNKRLKDEIRAGIQTIQYQLITLQTTNGQAPFITIFMYLNQAKNEREKEDLAMLIEEMITQRKRGVKSEDGTYISPAFPKLIYVTEEDNIHENSKYFYLTKLAAECSAERLVPDYISEKKMKELKNGDCYSVMGCRSALTPDRFTDIVGNVASARNYDGKHKYSGRFNQGVVTINLPDIALSSGGDFKKFWELFDERTELCHRALQYRHKRLLGTLSDVAPILWQDGAYARLEKHEKIDKLLFNGYSTISLGYVGLYETVKYMTGHSHSDGGEGERFGLEVMQALNNKCAEWKKAENIDYSLYGTPEESTTYKFAKCLRKRFGVIKDITDKDYVTNSYHIPVTEKIDAFDKLKIESKFQALSPGGAISYIESVSMKHNPMALVKVIQYMYDNIMYAEINTKSCYCEKCGYTGDIPIVDEGGILKWKCPKCGNDDSSTMDISFRVCGYIGTAKNGANQGRMDEIRNRVKHLDDIEAEES